MSVRELLQGSALAVLAAVVATALPATASARPDGEDGNAMQVRGERVQQANAARQQQRAQQVEQRSQQRAEQAQRQAPPQVAQADRRGDRGAQQGNLQGNRQGDRGDRQNNWQGNRQGDRGRNQPNRVEQPGTQPARQLEQRRDQGEQRNWQNERNRSYTDQSRNRDYARNGEGRGDNNWRDGRRDNDRNGNWQNDRRDNDRNNNWQNSRRDDDRNHRNWDRRWRDNNRYDWQRYRTANRTVFHVGTYYAPYRYYSYRPYAVGSRMSSLFYGSNYWITNPWQYRLPDVWGPYRWVRYYDDVLLVDIYTGQVVDGIHNFFW